MSVTSPLRVRYAYTTRTLTRPAPHARHGGRAWRPWQRKNRCAYVTDTVPVQGHTSPRQILGTCMHTYIHTYIHSYIHT